jgi:hypothetical protein
VEVRTATSPPSDDLGVIVFSSSDRMETGALEGKGMESSHDDNHTTPAAVTKTVNRRKFRALVSTFVLQEHVVPFTDAWACAARI